MKRQLHRILCYQCGSNHEVMRDFLNDVDVCYTCITKEQQEEEEEEPSDYDKELQREEQIYRTQGDK